MNDNIVTRRRQIFNEIQFENGRSHGSEDISVLNNQTSDLHGVNGNEYESSLSYSQSETNSSEADMVEAAGDDVPENIVILTDENGNQVKFEFLDLITYRKKEFVVLFPTEEESDQVVILQVESIGANEETYISVDNEYTLNAVFSLFREKHKHEFDFRD